MKRTLTVLLATAALVASGASAALANDGAVGTQGGTVRPVGNTDIRMDSEAVQIVCLDGYALYRIDFKFVNGTSEAKTVKLGFPFPDFENKEFENTGDAPGAFRAWLNGTELGVAQEKGKDSDGEGEWDVIWFTHTATFPPGESMITVHYIGTPDSSVMVPPMMEGVQWPSGATQENTFLGYYPYLVHTGAGWAGPIGTSVVRYTLADEFSGFAVDAVTRNNAQQDYLSAARTGNLLAYKKPAENVYEWTYKDYEPTRDHDTVIAFAQKSVWSDTFDPWAETKASSALKLGEFSYEPWAASNGNPGDAWAEAVAGPGIGQWIDIPFGETRQVRQLRVMPGYQKRADLFKKYNRPKRLKVEFSDGTVKELDLADELGMQVFDVDASATSAKVTILDVYKGTNERDETYLSEIDFAEGPAPRFETFQQVTGIAPPEGFVEPAALAALTVQAEEGPDEEGPEREDRDDGLEELTRGLADGDADWGRIAALVGGCCCCGLLLATIVLVVVLVARKKKTSVPAAAPAAPVPPAPPAPPAT